MFIEHKDLGRSSRTKIAVLQAVHDRAKVVEKEARAVTESKQRQRNRANVAAWDAGLPTPPLSEYSPGSCTVLYLLLEHKDLGRTSRKSACHSPLLAKYKRAPLVSHLNAALKNKIKTHVL